MENEQIGHESRSQVEVELKIAQIVLANLMPLPVVYFSIYYKINRISKAQKKIAPVCSDERTGPVFVCVTSTPGVIPNA